MCKISQRLVKIENRERWYDMKTTTEKIAEKLKMKRLQHGMTVEKLSEIADVSVGTISTLERKLKVNLSITTLLKLMDALNVEPYELFGSADPSIDELLEDNRALEEKLQNIADIANPKHE